MKIGLVVEGGGMKCAYNAAILDAFLDHNITFAYCMLSSTEHFTFVALFHINRLAVFN